jgi:hypothetical protein
VLDREGEALAEAGQDVTTTHTSEATPVPAGVVPAPTRSTEWRRNGRRVEPGTELSVTGARGRYRFVAHVQNAHGHEWIDCYGGPDGRAMFRSFEPARIKTVHYKTKARP